MGAAAELEHLGAATAGTLAEAPFPVLLQALFLAERTATIELRQKHLVKHLFVEEGVPVDCDSNLLHETPGRFLVEKGKLTDAQYQKALNDSVMAGERLEQTLLRLQLIQPFELFKLLQQNLAYKILDCFCATWADAKFRVLPDAPEVKQPLRINLPQLVFTGASTFSSFAEIEHRLEHLAMGVVGLAASPPHPASALKLSAKDARLLRELKARPSIELLVAKLDAPLEDVLRKLYALDVLGYLEVSAAPVRTTPASTPPPIEEPPLIEATPIVEAPAVDAAQVERARNDVTAAYLTYRSRDALELFELPESATAAQVREKFLAWSERFAPWRFDAAELQPLQEKARDLFLAGARAYAQLSDAEQRSLILKRRTAAREAATRKRTTDFSIKTDLLDAPGRYEEGMRKVAAGDHRGAIELLEFASACDPRKAIYRVQLAHARFLADPRAERQALAELEEAFRIDPGCGEAQLVMGQIQHASGKLDKADESYRRASKLMAGDRRPIEGMRAVAAEKQKLRA